ncbi:MAG: hypothetical protein ACI4IM_05500 [Acutalibacteraceae bacterium]
MNTKIKVAFAVVACVVTVAGFTACTNKNGKDEQITAAAGNTTAFEAVTEPNPTRVDEITAGGTEIYREGTTNSTTGNTAGTTKKQTTSKAPATAKTTEHRMTFKTTAKETVKSTTKKTAAQTTTKKITTTKATATTKIATTKPTTTNQEKVLYYYPDTGTYGYEPKEGALYQTSSGSWRSYVPGEITPEEIAESIKDIPHEKWY